MNFLLTCGFFQKKEKSKGHLLVQTPRISYKNSGLSCFPSNEASSAD